jgi:hypothetical protein
MTHDERLEQIEGELASHRDSLQHANDAISGLLDVARRLVAMIEQTTAEKKPDPPAPAPAPKKGQVVN